MDHFRRWTLATRRHFFLVVGLYTLAVIAVAAIAGVDYRVLAGTAFCGSLYAVVYNLRHGHRWDD